MSGRINDKKLCLSLSSILIITIISAISIITFFLIASSSGTISEKSNISNNTTQIGNSPQVNLYHNTYAYKPFTDADFYIDPISNIVITQQKEEWRNGYSLDLRGKEPNNTWSSEYNVWRSEFFCEPDTMVFVYNNNTYHQSYLKYLLWLDDVQLTKNEVVLAFLHMHDFGNISSLLPPDAMKNNDDVPLDIKEVHSHELGTNFVKTEVIIRNRGSETYNVVYIYQDAAYLWFSRANQTEIEPILYKISKNNTHFDVGIYESAALESGDSAFSGYVDREHGIISGIYSDLGWSKVGLIRYYIGLLNDPITSSKGDLFYRVNDTPVHFDDIPDDSLIYQEQYTFLRNRYVAFEINDLKPGESRSIHFYRIMYYTADRSLDNSTILTKIKEGINQTRSSGNFRGDLPEII